MSAASVLSQSAPRTFRNLRIQMIIIMAILLIWVVTFVWALGFAPVNLAET